ncbi:uncharacterized protein LOC113494311 isoform X3 [Trichoplusia ni]|uniref:Uncharacterized protein LOC113494311 isoform X3 n=1 Tax=Trichoplusia ni TaxID=7111 RepID=A0A7E5VJ94_TRINI|nr:uncharacterized protein LOC113494311 isoform X3 [Trichoplusia ni]
MSFEYKLHINYIIFLSIYILTFYMIYRKVQDSVVKVRMVNNRNYPDIETNVSATRSNLPEISYGMKCVYGKTYKMDCNTCRCGHRNTLMCTKVACLGPMNSEVIVGEKAVARSGQARGEGAADGVERKRRRRKIKRRGNRKTLRTDEGNPVSKPEDVRPPIKDKEFKSLQSLPHSASPCVPGNTYKVDCNACVCDDLQNLVCDKMLCISFADMHRTEAMKRSGLPCNTNNGQENEAIQSKCVKCVCNVTTFCEAIDDCITDAEKAMRTYSARRNGSRLTFDFNKQKCVPNHIYKDNCNKCYCQPDLTLRCTQKTCLNYNQATALQQQQQYLQEHGL